MKLLIKFVGLAVLILCAACSSTPQTLEQVQLPDSTPFDNDMQKRQYFLDAYRDGYRAGKRGEFTVPSTLGFNRRIQEMGWRAGMMEASRQMGGQSK